MSRTETTQKAEDALAGRLSWSGAALLLLAALLLWRVIYVLLFPLALSPDESYSWDLSRSLAWGYFSKPPMVAWLIALSTALLGDTDFGVRVPAAVLGVGSLACMYLLAGRMFDSRTAFRAVAAMASSIGFAAGGYIDDHRCAAAFLLVPGPLRLLAVA